MIAPSKVTAAARKLEKENLRFRAFLKNHADADELDCQFLKLHNELFAEYDCCQCSNCCHAYCTVLSDEEINSVAALIGLAKQEYIRQYLDQGSDGYELESSCRFLRNDGKCQIQECKPTECRSFPYTHKPDRMGSLLSIMSLETVRLRSHKNLLLHPRLCL